MLLLLARLARFDHLDLRQHIFIRWANLVINFNKLPAHYTFVINHNRRRMRDRAFGLFVEQSVTINHAMIGVREQREIEARLVFQFVACEQCFVVRVNADGEDFDFVAVLFFEQRFQLSKLNVAVRSPVAAIEDEHDGLLAAIIGERDGFAVLIFEREIGRGLASLDAVEIAWRQSRAVFRAKFGLC